ncbi:UNVERIFIED_CONTAM: Two-component response regulator ORR10 [Sesamum calycinum]|uniref:Two-component response regulator ORR10 n=1 Tax=Sesamum calycinum TaxID=2727403 RepID=A0AAW2J5W2_9LAMI
MSAIVTETQFHVLAVDDSLIDRKLIERLLKTSSYQVTAVDSGVKALEYLGLLDDEDTSPDSTPVSTTKNHHESTSLKDIPVVIMSSENVPSRINSCLEQGAEEFFLKPVRQSDVNKLRPHLMRTSGKRTEDHQPNKRKPMEECMLSPDRTRARYNDDLEL